MLNDIGDPIHELSVGVATMFPVNAVLPGFCPANDAISPEPLAAKPMFTSEFVQLTDAPAGVLEKFIAVVVLVTQSV